MLCDENPNENSSGDELGDGAGGSGIAGYSCYLYFHCKKDNKMASMSLNPSTTPKVLGNEWLQILSKERGRFALHTFIVVPQGFALRWLSTTACS